MKITELLGNQRQIVIRFDGLFEQVILENLFRGLWMNPSALKKIMPRTFSKSDLQTTMDTLQYLKDNFEAKW